MSIWVVRKRLFSRRGTYLWVSHPWALGLLCSCVLALQSSFLYADESELDDDQTASVPRVKSQADLGPQGEQALSSASDDATGQPKAPPSAEMEKKQGSGLLEALVLGKPPEEQVELEAQQALNLLGERVEPNQSAKLSWSPGLSFSGISAPVPVLVVNGRLQGPVLCLTGAIHGDELNGIEIVRHILHDVKPEELAGTLIGVPIVNMQGFRSSSRYLTDRRDLNRYFPGSPNGSSASRIAHSFFSQVISKCDYLIDIHTGSFRRVNLPQLRADLTKPEIAKLAGIMGAIVAVQSRGAPGTLRRAAVDAGIPAITVEAGKPMELEKEAVQHGIKSIETAMDAMGMVARRRFWELKSEPVYYQSRWVRVTQGGILFSEVGLGSRVKTGSVLGVVTDPITNDKSEIIAPFNGRVIGMAVDQVMNPGFAAYHLGYQSSVEEVQQGDEVLPSLPENMPDTNMPDTAGEKTRDDDPSLPPAEPESGDVS